MGAWANAEAFDRNLRIFAKKFVLFTDRFNELVPPERGASSTNGCLTRRPGCWRVRLIDWEDWSIATATDDLAYMIAMLWYPDRGHRPEKLLLDRYHSELLARGVIGYDREMLANDYQLSALWLITRPVSQATSNIPPRVWWNNLERIMLAVDDLGCRDLLA